jgi:hypothetical protein
MEELARVFLALVALALVIAVAKGGVPGIGLWFKAKFLGQAAAA